MKSCDVAEVECRPLSADEQSLQDLVAGRIVGRVVLEINGDR